MKLHRLATAGLVTSILSILAGAIVRATGSGDGCGASWPTCNGRVVQVLIPHPRLLNLVIGLSVEFC